MIYYDKISGKAFTAKALRKFMDNFIDNADVGITVRFKIICLHVYDDTDISDSSIVREKLDTQIYDEVLEKDDPDVEVMDDE